MKNEKIEIINKTPHEVVLVEETGEVIQTFPKSENPIRLLEETDRIGTIEGIPLSKTKMTAVKNTLPEEQEGIFYIVSRAVQEAYPNRKDLLIPNESVRDESGRIVGCKSLAVNETFRG